MTATEPAGSPHRSLRAPIRRKPRRFTPTQQRRNAHLVAYAIGLAVLLFLVFAVDWASLQETFFDWQIFQDQFPRIISIGARNTIIYALVSFAGGLLLALVLALMRLSDIRVYRAVSAVFVEVFRGLPLLLTLFIVGFGLPIATGSNLPTYSEINTAGVASLIIVSGAYMAETLRAGIEAVPRGQMEAARSLGMSRGQAMRMVVIPQAFRIVIPPLTNEFVLLLKDTSLVTILGVTTMGKDLTKFGRDASGDAFNSTPLIAAGLCYLVITIPLTRLVAQLEKRNRETR